MGERYTKMRYLLGLLAVTLATTLLGLTLAACGSAYKAGVAPPKTASDAAVTAGSRETVTTTASGLTYDSDDAPIRFYGHAAGPTETQAITALIKRYYAAAAANDGTTACGLIHSLIAEAIPENYDEEPALRGSTCAVVMSKLFKQRHRRHEPESATAEENATLKVIEVRIDGGTALALLRFADAPEANHIAVHLEDHTWKIWELFAIHMP